MFSREELENVIKEYPTLSIFGDAHELFLKGNIDIIDKDGKCWDIYEIEIQPSEEYPYRFAIVYEVGNKIMKTADWHVYEDHSCCLTVPPQEILACKNGINLLDFINNWVIPFFANHIFRKEKGYYANGEYSHGVKGIIEFYENELNVKGNLHRLIKLLLFVIQNPIPSRTADCFCGKKKAKFRRCHRNAFMKIKNIGEKQLNKDLQLMQSYYLQIKSRYSF